MAFQKGHQGGRAKKSPAPSLNPEATVEVIPNASATTNTPVVYGVIRMTKPSRATCLWLRNFDGNHPLFGSDGKEVEKYCLQSAETKLNLNNPYDKSIWDNAKDNPTWYAGKETANPTYTLVDIEKEAEQTIEQADSYVDAVNIIRDMSVTERADFGRVLGFLTDTISERNLYKQLLDMAKETPDAIIKAFDDPDRETRELARKAEQRKVFTKKANGAWYYNQQVIGANIDEAVLWLQKNEDLKPIISKAAEIVR